MFEAALDGASSNVAGECGPSASSTGDLSDIASSVVMDSCNGEHGAATFEYDGDNNSIAKSGGECIPSAT